ncbi:helicase domain-containing family protein [Dorcoceras hygrometricum]|uniref:Helicase domain-containing family protein n=1 Tax=Dorcoceras hygrometricum TaxID=472368 RepID=A0A2Z7CPI7_9LAMI|nr:helicase domain-containing family protein [Dorcoceras hygrometricum]
MLLDAITMIRWASPELVVDLIGIYGLKGPYCTLTTTNWFLQALSVIPRGSWGDVARRSYHDPMGKSGIVIPEPQWLWAHG